ncbi:transcriptional regulator, TetR family [Microbacterium sp. cf046]|uniref:TetR/AcrR family transcriptional regulator n=1 Tax=Microbacterium sp. cf046 TaxID=1761803 RepID=UPI0008E32C1F|nr:TetR/AcrR family transcriptional regulator [Microbacterium sp. cf046]SFS15386.1 transcriptional regulator, TetR family [Microbacterium sp. cf046]
MTDTIKAPSSGATTSAVTTRRREATRQKLLDAAALVFAEEGLDAASVEAICERAGFTRGAFYSNFDSKDELFLELAGRVARARVESVRERVATLERDGGLHVDEIDALAVVQEVLDVSGDDRLAILLMSEIRIHAMRDARLGAAYLAQDAEMRSSVAQIITDISVAKSLRFRLPADEVARLMLTVWESESVRATMAGLDYEAACRRTSEELARVALLVIDQSEVDPV